MKNVIVETQGAVGILTISRKERFNSLDVETARDFRKAGLQLARDESLRAVIVRGVDGIFCSGADLKYIRAGGNEDDLGYLKPAGTSARAPVISSPSASLRGGLPGEESRAETSESGQSAGDSSQPSGAADLRQLETTGVRYGEIFKQILEYIHSTISEIRRAPKPFIAAVDGVAAAGGFGIAMCCDLVVASERATFEWAYAKTGLTGAESSTFFLPKLVGFRRAMDLMLLNPRLDARQAFDLGLVSRVLPTATFDAGVLNLAKELAEGPTEALGIAKSLINQSAGMDRLDFHLDRELDQLARIADGANFAEGITAFFEKRPPRFGVR